MSQLVARLKRAFFRARGVDPDAIVVSFASGPEKLAAAMQAEARELIPDRRHFTVERQPAAASTLAIWLRLRRQFRGHRIGMAPVLFGTGPEDAPLRRAAFLLAPRKILAYNGRLERHHLQASQPVSSLLFFLGVPLDRIHLRPWFWPFPKRDHTVAPDTHRVIEGRPASPTRAPFAVLTPFFPWPLSHGGAVRLYYLLRECSIECDIDLYAFTERETDADFAALARFCRRLYLVPKPRYREPGWSTLTPPQVREYESPAMRRLIAANRAPLQVEYTHLAAYGGSILVEHDITEDLYRQIHAREHSLGSWWNWRRWRRYERRALGRAQAVVVMSEKDAALAAHPRAVVIANGVDLDRFVPSPEPAGVPPRLLFIGSLRHFPNRGAFRFFLEEVWPGVRAARPDAELVVVAGPDPEIFWQGELPKLAGVTIHGFVPDVKPLYDATNLVLVPTLVSAGTNIKVLEAMAMERAVVSTPSGCAGLGLVHGESIWIADSASAFEQGVLELLGDAGLRARLARSARAHAVRHFSWRELGRRQRELWSGFAPPPLRIRPGGPADLAAIERIQAAAPGSAAQWPARDYLAHQLWVAEHNGTPAGFAVTRTIAPDEHELLNLVVARELRRAGIGARLLETATASLPGTIFLEVRESNQAARLLYEKVGFYVVNRRPAYYQNPEEPGIVMALRKC